MADATQTGVGKAFQLQVITPERIMYDTRATALIATASDGMLGVLKNHAPLVTPLVPGELVITSSTGEKQHLAAGEGFLEVCDNKVRVLVDTAETPEEIDAERARQALERAKERLAQRGLKDVDYPRAEAALRRALIRLRTKQSLG
ncbi:MAG: ATP synthase F1 subunit epsilon [Planctomycetota bacterium]